VLIDHGYDVVSSDIAAYGYGTAGVDIFSRRTMPDDCTSLVTNPPYGNTGSHEKSERSAAALLSFLRHTLSLAEAAEGQLALLVRFQWIAGRRAAALMSQAPSTAVVALTKRIRWFDMGERTNNAQHHHAWIVFDYQAPKGRPPALLFAGDDGASPGFL
jgi:hypothetical protein